MPGSALLVRISLCALYRIKVLFLAPLPQINRVRSRLLYECHAQCPSCSEIFTVSVYNYFLIPKIKTGFKQINHLNHKEDNPSSDPPPSGVAL